MILKLLRANRLYPLYFASIAFTIGSYSHVENAFVVPFKESHLASIVLFLITFWEDLSVGELVDNSWLCIPVKNISGIITSLMLLNLLNLFGVTVFFRDNRKHRVISH